MAATATIDFAFGRAAERPPLPRDCPQAWRAASAVRQFEYVLAALDEDVEHTEMVAAILTAALLPRNN